MRGVVLGPEGGWHADRLRAAASRVGIELQFAAYEQISAHVAAEGGRISAGPVRLDTADLILSRTMPAGTLEQITFRLAILHALEDRGVAVVNRPRALEMAIDKFATLERLRRLGLAVVETVCCQTRSEALAAYEALGGDVVVKPLFGGEGRGVMRIRDRQLAWQALGTLERLGSVLYVQRFVPPGGRDLRVLCCPGGCWAVRRENTDDWRTNVACGAQCTAAELDHDLESTSRRIMDDLGLQYGAIDFLEDTSAGRVVLEVNAVPGWKGAEAVLGVDFAQRLLSSLVTCPAVARAGADPCPLEPHRM